MGVYAEGSERSSAGEQRIDGCGISIFDGI
jgi:hypothetical protein